MYLTHPGFKPKNIIYGFFTKDVNGSSHRYFHTYDNHLENNLAISRLIGADKIAVIDQQHTNEVIEVRDANGFEVADGQVTTNSKLPLAVCTADCVPILFADDENKIVAAVHSGWRGSRKSIPKVAIEKMRARGAKNITAIIGPCIKQENYEVSHEFYDDFLSESPENTKYFKTASRSLHYLFDLTRYVIDKIDNCNIDQIFDMNINTYPEKNNLFSFRRTTHNPESPMGNNVSFIMLK